MPESNAIAVSASASASLVDLVKETLAEVRELKARVVLLETNVSRHFVNLEERMEDLEDKSRYSRNAAKYGSFNASPRTYEPMSSSMGSVNASARDSIIFPSLAS